MPRVVSPYPLLLTLLVSALAAAEAAPDFAHGIRPLLETYCFKCHGPEKRKGDVDLAAIAGDEDAARRATRVWRAALPVLHHHEMPPEKSPQPSQAERERLITWISGLRRPMGAPDPGRVTVRRLNRSEYDNTIRDLIGLDLKPSADFPADDIGAGFDNLGDVLSLPPLLLEKYLDAARSILDRALVSEPVSLSYAGEQLPAVHNGKRLPAKADGGARVLTGPGEVVLEFVAPLDGRYTLKIRSGADQAGNEVARLAVKVGSAVVKELKVSASTASPAVLAVPLTLEKGPRRISVYFMNPYTEPTVEPGKPGAAPARPAGGPAMRALSVDQLDLNGPPTPPLSESHKRLISAHPGPQLSKHDAARAVIEPFATRAFRRPVTADKLAGLLALFDLADQQGVTYVDALKVALQAVLVSPQFLFRLETDRPSQAPGGIYALDDWELAARLSYFLWSSLPDEELSALARQGALHEPSQLEQQARRMLKDAKARALVDNFVGQWLQLRDLESVKPDPQRFPEFDKPLRQAMHDEVALFAETVMREDRSVLEFIDADWTVVNERLARHYGITGVSGPAMRRITLTEHTRGGVLGMAGILTITSNPARTSPVKRGKWILEQILGAPPPPPPPSVAELPERGAAVNAGLSLRQVLERHRADPACASCHQRMDPLGFAIENFDAIGRWRSDDDGVPIDPSGVLPGGTTFRGTAALKAILLTRTDDFVRCLSGKLLTFALGRSLQDGDDPTLEAMAAAMARDQYRFTTLVTSVVTSYPFRYRRPAR
jgi:hypothetical protein